MTMIARQPHTKSSRVDPAEEIGFTQSFVLGSGFEVVDDFDALLGDGNTRRLFAQITADPDRPEVRPGDAYLSMLSSMQPGWIVRVLQTFWPDPLPRQRFFELVLGWPEATAEGTSILKDGLLLAAQQQGIPYTRKTILEFIHPGTEGIPWWQSLPDMFAAYGVHMQYLAKDEIEALAHWIFNPNLGA
jgi:hypothetical protein